MSCSVPGCRNTVRVSRNVSFFRFPKDDDAILDLWLEALNITSPWKWSRYKRICSDHFQSNDFVYTEHKLILKRDAVPSIFPEPGDIKNMQRRGAKDINPFPKTGIILEIENSLVNSIGVIKAHATTDVSKSGEKTESSHPNNPPTSSDSGSSTPDIYVEDTRKSFSWNPIENNATKLSIKRKLEDSGLTAFQDGSSFSSNILKEQQDIKKKGLRIIDCSTLHSDPKDDNSTVVCESCLSNKYREADDKEKIKTYKRKLLMAHTYIKKLKGRIASLENDLSYLQKKS